MESVKVDDLGTDDVIRARQSEEMVRGSVACSCIGDLAKDVPVLNEEGPAVRDGGFVPADKSSVSVIPLISNL